MLIIINKMMMIIMLTGGNTCAPTDCIWWLNWGGESKNNIPQNSDRPNDQHDEDGYPDDGDEGCNNGDNNDEIFYLVYC